MRWLPTDVPTTYDEESVSDVIVLSEAIPDTAAVVHRLMPIITRSQHSQRAMVTAVDAGPPTSQEGNQNHNCNARPRPPAG